MIFVRAISFDEPFHISGSHAKRMLRQCNDGSGNNCDRIVTADKAAEEVAAADARRREFALRFFQ